MVDVGGAGGSLATHLRAFAPLERSHHRSEIQLHGSAPMKYTRKSTHVYHRAYCVCLQDLIRAVRAASPALHAPLGLPPKASSVSTSSLSLTAGMGIGSGVSRTTRVGVMGASASTPSLAMMDAMNGAETRGDPADTAEQTLKDVEAQVNQAAKRYNDMKRVLLGKEKRLASLRTELTALEAENQTLAAVESRTHMLALSGGATKRSGKGGGMMADGGGSSTLIDAKTGSAWSNPWEESSDEDVDNDLQGVVPIRTSGATSRGGNATMGGIGSHSLRLGTSSSLPGFGASLTRSATGASGVLGGTLSMSLAMGSSSSSAALLTPGSPPPVSSTHALAASAALGMPAVILAGESVAPVTLTPVEAAEVDRIRALRKQIKSVRRNMTRREFTRRQYEHMAARLRVNASAFERHMKGLDDAIRAARKELSDVSGYLRLLEASRDGSVVDLHKLQLKMGEERSNRIRDLEERRAELSRAQRMEEWGKQRAAVRAEMRAELAGDLGKEQEEQLIRTLNAKEGALAALLEEKRAREERAAALHDAYSRIKATTGVSSLEEMVER